MGDTLGSEGGGRERGGDTNEQFYSFIAANSQGIGTPGRKAEGQSPDIMLINDTLGKWLTFMQRVLKMIIVFYNAAVSNTACAEQMSLKNTEITIIQKSLYCDKLFLYFELSFITLLFN